jgi:predicted unusual protein kinase regulating ubiquinone biosynthesis (AarF/ABC1/UbiB family)
MTRNIKFLNLLKPILGVYRKNRNKVTQLRLAKKVSAPTEYYRQKNLWMDETHKLAAPMCKTLLEEMGGLYNKAAQDLVTRGMIIPKAVVDVLGACFENMPERSWESVLRTITKSLGKGNRRKGKDVFKAEFVVAEQALASASIGQVHQGRLVRTGQCIVIKVLYPEIRKHMSADLANLRQAVHLFAKMLNLAAMRDAIEAIALELFDNFPRELDFNIEIAHTQHARALLARHSKRILVPQVFPALSDTSMLVLEQVDGWTFNRIARERDPAKIASARQALDEVVQALGEMIFRDGFFHADPHPGNLMLTRDGRAGPASWHRCIQIGLN